MTESKALGQGAPIRYSAGAWAAGSSRSWNAEVEVLWGVDYFGADRTVPVPKRILARDLGDPSLWVLAEEDSSTGEWIVQQPTILPLEEFPEPAAAQHRLAEL